MDEIVFEITQETDGGFVAEALGEGIFTEADTWEQLRANVKEAVAAYYFDRPAPLRLGTLQAIIRSVAAAKRVSREDILATLV